MKKNMKKKLLTIIMCVLLSVPLIGGIAFAANLVSISNWSMAEVYSVSYGEGKKVKYSLDELIKTYKNSGAEYRKLDLTYQLNDLNSSQLDTQLSSQNEGIYNYTQLINQNEALITTYQNQMTSLEEGSDEWKTLATSMDACYMNLKAYRAYIEEAVAIKADILAQQESYKFIKANAELLSKQEQKKQISVTIERCLSLIVLKEKNNLADSSVEYNNTLLQIQKTNFEKGRATQIDIDYNEAELIYQKNISESISSGYDNLFKYILRTFNISDEQNTEISIDVKGLRPQNKIGYSTVENSFNNNDIKAKQLKNNISTIDSEIDILDDSYGAESIQLAIVKKKRDIASLELEQWLIERSDIINNLYTDYETKYDAVDIQEKRAEAQHKKYTVALNKFNLGLISKIELEEAEMMLRQSELDAWTALYDYVRVYNALELAMIGLV